MYNSSFYPTPKAVALKMFARLGADELRKRTFLEPSAGKGDLADTLCDMLQSHFGRYTYRESDFKDRVSCVEIEPELEAALRGKGYRIAGRDFLNWLPDEHFDCIIMNPPFANADAHLLHAWDILPEGDILCLVNSETLANPCTQKREKLAALIREHGETEDFGECFTDAFRKTDVRVSLVHLTKPRQETMFSFTGLEHDKRVEGFDTSTLEGQVATRNTIGNMVLEYKKSREIFREVARLSAELGYYSRYFKGCFDKSMEDMVGNSLAPLFNGTPDSAAMTKACSIYAKHLKKAAWKQVFAMSKFSSLISRGVQADFDTFCRNNETLSFSEDNIAALLESLFMSRGDIMRRCIVESFDWMTRYVSENRLHEEGWKTNDAWKVNRRVILPCCVDAGWTNPHIRWGYQDNLNDIDRAMAFLEGKKLENVYTIVEAFDKLGKNFGHGALGRLFESEYFECRGYKKGTLHLLFKDTDLWERFNIEAADGKGWLPDDYKARHKAEKEAAEQKERDEAVRDSPLLSLAM